MIEPVERKIQELNIERKKALKKQRDENLLRWGFDGRKKNKNDIPLLERILIIAERKIHLAIYNAEQMKIIMGMIFYTKPRFHLAAVYP